MKGPGVREGGRAKGRTGEGALLPTVALVCAAAVLILLGTAHVASRHAVIRLGYELTEATAELRRHEEENRRLRLEKSVLTSPERIERLARALGMVSPGPDQVRNVDASGASLPAMGWKR